MLQNIFCSPFGPLYLILILIGFNFYLFFLSFYRPNHNRQQTMQGTTLLGSNIGTELKFCSQDYCLVSGSGKEDTVLVLQETSNPEERRNFFPSITIMRLKSKGRI